MQLTAVEVAKYCQELFGRYKVFELMGERIYTNPDQTFDAVYETAFLLAQARKERDAYKQALEAISNQGSFSNRNAANVAKSVLKPYS